MYIGIAGNIGSGKSAMAELLSVEFGFRTFDSGGDIENPYLSNFYANMQRWALNLQVYFLTKRFKSIQRAMWTDGTVVQDRTIYEDAYIFVENLMAMGLIDRTDYDTYRELFEVMVSFIKPPELLIYLKASVPTLVTHIRQRGLAYENSIGHEYLHMLNRKYDEWVEGYQGNILTIDIDNTDFVNNA
ncbi:deoxynucleoside kinase, partial [Salmonella enterica]|nr:deoxynucleoside kinase [Salmonella enterica]